ncbi:hypothetical protein PF002_g5028 [Phytophthora fragariae]|uniref:Uncharacterized protein n=1 Tax=Phytophthora fragariae TaxID=53985 RepID=A0A6A4A290_9STRA|nr:hypothetical protein PF003_g12324 [Phytophthora fragariae]KAE9249956.1 hypothetical protein PF002_g5028 [Phytophthora fragariae]
MSSEIASFRTIVPLPSLLYATLPSVYAARCFCSLVPTFKSATRVLVAFPRKISARIVSFSIARSPRASAVHNFCISFPVCSKVISGCSIPAHSFDSLLLPSRAVNDDFVPTSRSLSPFALVAIHAQRTAASSFSSVVPFCNGLLNAISMRIEVFLGHLCV